MIITLVTGASVFHTGVSLLLCWCPEGGGLWAVIFFKMKVNKSLKITL